MADKKAYKLLTGHHHISGEIMAAPGDVVLLDPVHYEAFKDKFEPYVPGDNEKAIKPINADHEVEMEEARNRVEHTPTDAEVKAHDLMDENVELKDEIVDLRAQLKDLTAQLKVIHDHNVSLGNQLAEAQAELAAKAEQPKA